MLVKYERLEKMYKVYGRDSDVCSMKNQVTFDDTLYPCLCILFYPWKLHKCSSWSDYGDWWDRMSNSKEVNHWCQECMLSLKAEDKPLK
jgi:hypothetical protein